MSWRWKLAAPSFTRSASSALKKRLLGSAATSLRVKFISSSLQLTSAGRICGSRLASVRFASTRSR